MDRRAVKSLIEAALTKYFEVETDMPADANERAVTHRIAVYLEARLHDLGERAPDGRPWSVDCEYNRAGMIPKRLVGLEHELADGESAECLARDTKGRTIFPDIIVHRRRRRGAKWNLIVIELKRKAESRAAIERDRIKLAAYKDEIKYQHAHLVLLGAEGDFVVE